MLLSKYIYQSNLSNSRGMQVYHDPVIGLNFHIFEFGANILNKF